jgi:hypothetical protein
LYLKLLWYCSLSIEEELIMIITLIHRRCLLSMLLLLAIQVLFGATTADAATKVYTPKSGSAERRILLDVMRRKVLELHQLDVRFVVKEMHVSSNWAWVHTLPRSKDGVGRYEDVIAILQKKNGTWRIAEIPCVEPDNADCMDRPDYVSRLRKRFPEMPAAILPSEMRKQNNPFSGYWRENDGEIQELVLSVDRTFSVTAHPFERYKDYWGHYSYDLKKRTISFLIDGGNKKPADFDLDGFFRFNKAGDLVLDSIFFGTLSPGDKVKHVYTFKKYAE